MMENFKEILETCAELCVLSYCTDKYIHDALKSRFDIVKLVSKKDTEFITAINNEFVYICFSGTEPEEIKDILLDLNIRKIHLGQNMRVHKGFYTGFKKVEHQVYDMINKYAYGKKIVLCGHSLGGALAVIAAYFLVRRGIQPFCCMTFGQPRTGNSAFAKFCDDNINIYRFFIDADIVPKVPPVMWGYRHAGKPVMIRTKPTFMSRKWIEKYVKYWIVDFLIGLCFGIKYLIRLAGYYTVKAIVYHKMETYYKHVKNHGNI